MWHEVMGLKYMPLKSRAKCQHSRFPCRLSPRPAATWDMSSDDVAPLEVVRSTHVWMNDGTIVLQAHSSNTNKYLLFRVHKSVLALNCAAFQALFGDDTAVLDQSSEQYEGIPMMHTYEDANDMEDFLRALYYPECVLANSFVREADKRHL